MSMTTMGALLSRRRLPVAAGVALAVVGSTIVLVARSGGAVATNETYPVPVSGVFTVTGHGNGHGHGLSQYGAKARADAGQNASQILNFYYPGTASGTATGTVRVRLTRQGASEPLTVAAATGLVVRDAAGTSTALSGPGLYRITNSAGTLAVSNSADGTTWTPVTLTTGTSTTGPLTFAGPAVQHWVYAAGTARDYEGTLSAAPGSGGTGLLIVNEVDIEKYIDGVVPSEVFSSWPAATLQAQAVAARTFVSFEKADAPAGRGYDTCDSAACQAYNGLASYDADGTRQPLESATVNAAVLAVAGQIRTFAGAPAFTQFSASNGGWTVAEPAHPYLAAAADPYDLAAGNPYANWTATLPSATVAGCFLPAGSVLDRIVVTSRDGNGDWHGRITGVRVEGHQGGTLVSGTGDGDDLRSCGGLRSVYFTITSTVLLTSEPAAVADSHGNTDLFAAGPAGDVLHRRNVSGHGWQPWSSLGGGLTGSPGALRLADGSSRVYIRSATNNLYEGRLTAAGAFLGWQRRVTGGVTSRPYPVRLPDGSVHVYYLSGTALRYTSFTASDGLGSTVNLGGNIQADIAPAAAVTGPGAVTVVVAANGTHAIATRSLVSGRWSAWATIGGATNSDLGASSPAAGVVDIYLRATSSGALYTRRATKGRWSGWTNTGGGLSAGIFASTLGANTQIWSIGVSGKTYLRPRTASGFGAWTPLP
jgi:SpoIID/LytB domain protein